MYDLGKLLRLSEPIFTPLKWRKLFLFCFVFFKKVISISQDCRADN